MDENGGFIKRFRAVGAAESRSSNLELKILKRDRRCGFSFPDFELSRLDLPLSSQTLWELIKAVCILDAASAASQRRSGSRHSLPVNKKPSCPRLIHNRPTFSRIQGNKALKPPNLESRISNLVRCFTYIPSAAGGYFRLKQGVEGGAYPMRYVTTERRRVSRK